MNRSIKHPRAAARHYRRVQVRFRSRGEQDWRQGFSTNVSASGLFVATSRPLPLGLELELEVVTGEEGYALRAIVARSERVPVALQQVKPSGMGLSFVGSHPGLLKLLHLEAAESPALSPARISKAEGLKQQAKPAERRGREKDDVELVATKEPEPQVIAPKPLGLQVALHDVAGSQVAAERPVAAEREAESTAIASRDLERQLDEEKRATARLKSTAETLKQEAERLRSQLGEERSEREKAAGKAKATRTLLAEQLEKARQNLSPLNQRLADLAARNQELQSKLERDIEERPVEDGEPRKGSAQWSETVMAEAATEPVPKSRFGKTIAAGGFSVVALAAAVGLLLGLGIARSWSGWLAGPDAAMVVAASQPAAEGSSGSKPATLALDPAQVEEITDQRSAGQLNRESETTVLDRLALQAAMDVPSSSSSLESESANDGEPEAGGRAASAFGEEPSPVIGGGIESEVGEGELGSEATGETAPSKDQLVISAVQSWAAAWSDRRVDDYLSWYGAEYVPPNNLSREAYAENRRQRLLGVDEIVVELGPITVEPAGDRMLATFRQKYVDDRYRDEVRKELELAWANGKWLIVAERSAPL